MKKEYVLLQGTEHQLGMSYDFLQSKGLIAPDKYREVYRGNIETEDTEPDAVVLEKLYGMFNRDDRPNAKTAWSMSMGDITVLAGKAYICDGFGFVFLPNFVWKEGA